MHSTGESEAREAANLLDVINALGADGWELMGAPETQNAIVPIRTHDGGYNESARWVQRRFWLKRELV
jgi:hypothetical protein